MIREKNVLSDITDLLAVLLKSIELKGILHFHDEKTAAENFFKDLFNIVYNLRLVNLNSVIANYPAIDLGDNSSGVCYQITCENTAKKIKETQDTYDSHSLRETYPQLRIFIFDKKPPKRAANDNVEYVDDFLNSVSNLSVDKKSEVLTYLRSNLNFEMRERKQALELSIICKTIKFLSDRNSDDEEASEVSREKPYPEEKIQLRFEDYKEQIKEEYGELYPEYYSLLEQAKNQHIDDGNSRRIKSYLRKRSRDLLYECEGNSRAALDILVDEIVRELSESIFVTAARFYILSELFECDVFPLSSKEREVIEGVGHAIS